MTKMIKKTKVLSAIAAIGLAFSASAHAGLVNDVPSCYAANHFKFQSAAPDKLIYVLIDQTVQLDPNLQQSVISNLNRMLGPKTKFVVAEFSAFSQGRYLNVLNTGIIEAPMTQDESSNIPLRQLPNFKSCMDGQAKFSVALADKAANTAMQGATSSLDQSDIMSALQNVSSAIKSDPAKDKVLFLVTDGLENSSVSSFYANHIVRKIDPAAELQKAKAADLMGDFGGAKVFVLGAGTLQPAKTGSKAARDGYRDPVTIHRLNDFWAGYFKGSNANLVEFGAPALVTPLSY
ncbi:MAG: hypothetical protein B7X43_01000 [Thiomonas sp. 15-63-373]|jgi:hypothetical protein|nr:MAG: hypothetical protein B7X43_01000 [Thiomonas sp. 15-63-373]